MNKRPTRDRTKRKYRFMDWLPLASKSRFSIIIQLTWPRQAQPEPTGFSLFLRFTVSLLLAAPGDWQERHVLGTGRFSAVSVFSSTTPLSGSHQSGTHLISEGVPAVCPLLTPIPRHGVQTRRLILWLCFLFRFPPTYRNRRLI